MANESEPVIATTVAAAERDGQYDPKKDPARKAKSKDPGWKYAFWPEIGNRDLVQCSLCDRKICGGIKRLKQHLTGGYGDVQKCAKTTTPIIKEMQEYLKQNRRNRPLNLDDEEEDNVVEVASGSGSIASTVASVVVPVPSSGTAAKRKQSALNSNVPAPKAKQNKSIAAMLRPKPEDVVEQRHTKGTSQCSLESKMRTKEERHAVNMHVSKFFYECGIAFNATHARSFEVMCESIGQYGPGYKPPSYHELRVPLLEENVKETNKLREKHEEAWKQYGCTLMSDGWTDRKGRHLINFLVNSPEGTFFLESVDVSDQTHDARMLADLLEKRIENVGKGKVVQVVNDNGANYKAAGKLLMERIPTLFWTPCAAHCLDLMLEDIGKLKEFKKPIARAKRVTTFIYRHGKLLNAMREKTGGRDLVRPTATRFATSFLTLRSLHKHKDALRYLFVSEDWTRAKLATTEAGKSVYDIILSKEFWNSVEDCLRASQPLLVVLRVVDGDEKPALPEVAACMAQAKEKIKSGFPTQNKSNLLKKIMNIIDTRWVKQMDQKLYGAALFLNPGKFFSIVKRGDDAYVGELRGAFNDVLAKMVPDVDLRNKLDTLAILYEDQRGEAFSNQLAIQNQESRNPLDWWRAYGGRAIELQRFAKRIVSLCCSSSGCERNWSTFEFIHTKKRNRLDHQRLNDLVYVQYNQKMKSRFEQRRQKGDNDDPLVIDEFDWDNEWINPLAEPVQGHRGCDDLTWEHVDEAVGASRTLQGRNLPRTLRRGDVISYSRRHTSSSTRRVVEEGETHSNSDTEDEDEDFVFDDEEVDDYGEAPPDDMESDGGNMDGNDLDAFDIDDY